MLEGFNRRKFEAALSEQSAARSRFRDKLKPEYQQLHEEADRLDREADRMEGASFYGDMSPSSQARAEADRKRRLAEMLPRGLKRVRVKAR